MVTTAERLIYQGYEQGEQKGLQKGLQKGKYQGLLETAKKMFEQGFEIELIRKITGLSKKEINIAVKK